VGATLDDLDVYERNSNTPNIYKASKTITFLSEYTDVRYNEYTAVIEAGLALCTPQCNVQPPLNTSDADIYIRDATGNVLAVYHYDRKTSQLRWSEQHLYGSARLGMYLPEKSVTSVSTDSKQREVGYLGKQVFELSNHLGNILATITDKKLQVSLNTTSTAYFEADVQTVQDYYAFGAIMPGRNFSSSNYKYGHNGKEKDDEVKGSENWYDYGLRPYDPRIGRPPCIDPLAKKYPELSPYQFYHNNPIKNIDLDGAEGLPNEIFEAAKRAGVNMIKKATAYAVSKVLEMTVDYAAEKTAEKIKEKTTPAQQQEIGVTLEFITGKGPEVRNFGPNAPITQSLKSSNFTTEALTAFYKGYQDYQTGNRKDMPAQYRVDFNYFYPLGGDTGPFKEYSKDGWTSAQFIGTAMFNFSFDTKTNMLNVHVYDTKNEYSFLLHMPGTDKHKRSENPIMGETIQTYDFSIPMEEVKKRATGN
jgi:RHS repeat-associated protein